MKTQLLEDIGESHSDKVPALPKETAGMVAPVPPLAREAAPALPHADPQPATQAMPDAGAGTDASPLLNDIEAELALLSVMVAARPDGSTEPPDAAPVAQGQAAIDAAAPAAKVWQSRPAPQQAAPAAALKVWRKAHDGVQAAPLLEPQPAPQMEPQPAPQLKLASSCATGAPKLVSADCGCLLNIGHAAKGQGAPLTVEHMASFLWRRATGETAEQGETA